MLSTVLAGAVIAISFAAPPGPVAMETIRRGLRGGFAPALRVQLGSIIGDLTWCSAALLGLAPLVQLPWVRGALAVAGVGLLIYLGGASIREAFKGSAAVATESAAETAGAFRSGLAISMANPMAVGYWLSVGGALVAAGVVGRSPEQTGSFIMGFLGGTFLWAVLMAAAVRWGRHLIAPAGFRAVHAACGAALLFFGAALAAQMIATLL